MPGFGHMPARRARKGISARLAALRGLFQMKRLLLFACAIVAIASLSCGAQAQNRAKYETLVATHAKTNLVPEALVHRVIVRESKYRADLVGRGGTIGLMQIKLATARGLGYAGDAQGLRDPDTNLAYGIKYLAGAYRAANGDHARAMHYYASGYYHAAKQRRLARVGRTAPVLANAPPQEVAAPNETAIKPQESAKSKDVAAKPKPATAIKSKELSKRLTEAKARVPRPLAGIPGGTNVPKPR
jgi:soluble lytic murein transglycosylase-like protein